MDYNHYLQQPWIDSGFDVIYTACCLQIPDRDDGRWEIRFPDRSPSDDAVILMHCQDFLNVEDGECRELEIIQNHFGDHAHKVVVITWNLGLDDVYQGPLNIAYFPTHSFEILVNLARQQHAWKPALNRARQHRWQCLNGVSKKHRVRVANRVRDLGSGILSLNPDRPVPDWPYYPCYQTCSNEENYLRLLHVYGDCDINIVTETLYNHRPGIISEKTLLALLSLQIPILIGYAGIVSDLASLGFDVFDDLVDTGYDWLANERRLDAAIDLNRELLISGIDRSRFQQRLESNQQLALGWPSEMIKNYQHRVREIQRDWRG